MPLFEGLCRVRCQLAFILLRASIRCPAGFRFESHQHARLALLDHVDVVLPRLVLTAATPAEFDLNSTNVSQFLLSTCFRPSDEVSQCSLCIVHGCTCLYHCLLYEVCRTMILLRDHLFLSLLVFFVARFAIITLCVVNKVVTKKVHCRSTYRKFHGLSHARVNKKSFVVVGVNIKQSRHSL